MMLTRDMYYLSSTYVYHQLNSIAYAAYTKPKKGNHCGKVE